MGTLHGTFKRLSAALERFEAERQLIDVAECEGLIDRVCGLEIGEELTGEELRSIAFITRDVSDWMRYVNAPAERFLSYSKGA